MNLLDQLELYTLDRPEGAVPEDYWLFVYKSMKADSDDEEYGRNTCANKLKGPRRSIVGSFIRTACLGDKEITEAQ